MDHSNTIAWLIPSARNRLATEAARMPENEARLVLGGGSSGGVGLGLGLGDICEEAPSASSPHAERCNQVDQSEGGQLDRPTQTALKLTFDKGPKGRHGFVLGTDAALCDIVLPKIPGVSRQHCYISFDHQHRLIVRDFSSRGTAVWYDGNSNGDRRQESWVLSSGGSYGFPDTVKKIVIDIQTIRFQVIIWEPSAELEAYKRKVDDFLSATTVMDDIPETQPDISLATTVPRPTFVKYSLPSDDGLAAETYLWNVSRPWEPMMKVGG